MKCNENESFWFCHAYPLIWYLNATVPWGERKLLSICSEYTRQVHWKYLAGGYGFCFCTPTFKLFFTVPFRTHCSKDEMIYVNNLIIKIKL